MGNSFGQTSEENGQRRDNMLKRATEGHKSWLFWLLILVVGLIIIFMVYFFFWPPANSKKLSPEDEFGDEFSVLNRLEDTLLAWITIATFFITLGIIIKGFERYSVYYSLGFLVLGAIMLVMANINFLNDRGAAMAAGFNMRPRLNVLYFITIVGIIITTVIIYDIILYEVYGHKLFDDEDQNNGSSQETSKREPVYQHPGTPSYHDWRTSPWI